MTSEEKKKYTEPPLCYVGGKFRLLPQLMPLFPENIKTYADPFCGGLAVPLAVNAEKYILSDSCASLVSFWKYLLRCGGARAAEETENIIGRYGLTVESGDGYYRLRDDYNSGTAGCADAAFCALAAYGYNHQIRFSGKGNFNNPAGTGRSRWNSAQKTKLLRTADRLAEEKPVFLCGDFRDFPYGELGAGDFLYADPPYLITGAAYNSGWTEKDDRDLADILCLLGARGVRAALSDVISHGDRVNALLSDLSRTHRTEHLSADYTGSTWNRKGKLRSDEILMFF